MKALVGTFNQDKAIEGAFYVITNLWMDLFQALFQDSPHRDSALNAVLLTCSDGKTLTSKEGSQGKWSSEVNVTGLRGATMRDGSNARYGASAIKFEERIWYIKKCLGLVGWG